MHNLKFMAKSAGEILSALLRRILAGIPRKNPQQRLLRITAHFSRKDGFRKLPVSL
jgi:hypothetical protein